MKRVSLPDLRRAFSRCGSVTACQSHAVASLPSSSPQRSCFCFGKRFLTVSRSLVFTGLRFSVFLLKKIRGYV